MERWTRFHHFQFELLGEDWDQFEILMTNAIHRTPCLETAEIKMLLNGPESFTPDGNFILGEAPELRNYFVAAGFNSAGIANSGGASRLMAEVDCRRRAANDLWDVDIRRFGCFTGNRRALFDRTAETLGLHYAMRWPRQELETAARCAPRRSTICWPRRGMQSSAAKTAGSAPITSNRPPARPSPGATPGQAGLAALVIRTACHARRGCATTRPRFQKLLLQAAMRWRCCSACARTRSMCPSTEWSTPRCSMHAVALKRSHGHSFGCRRFLIITGSAQTTRDMDWISRHIGQDQFAADRCRPRNTQCSLMGPNAQALLAR